MYLRNYFAIFLVISIASISTTAAQGGSYKFLGQGSDKLYFGLRGTSVYDWLMGINYCHTYGLMSASIDTEQDYEVLRQFLNSTAEEDKRSYWLGATDHRTEGIYQWMWNREQVLVGNWSVGMPSGDRSKNCLVINKDGYYQEESCGLLYVHETLCQSPILHHKAALGNTDASYLNYVKQFQGKYDGKGVKHWSTTRLEPIGGIGNKQYFVDNALPGKKFATAMDFCHQVGMKLASPETQEEIEFLTKYVQDQDEIGGISTYVLAATDTLTVSCSKSNTEFRWFYSGNKVLSNETIVGDHWWYKCVGVNKNGLFVPDCIGFTTGSLCEAEI